MIRWIYWISVLAIVNVQARDIHRAMEDWFNRMNIVSNSSSPDFVNSQLGVHFLGGDGTTKMNTYSINPTHVSLPKISAGCGGIDYTMGAIHIASKDEIKKALKSIASNGAGYAFLLGIETVSPVVASTMKEIQHWANQLNAININSCELASSIVQGLWPKNTAAKEYICAHAATENPLFSDLIESKHGCRDYPEVRQKAISKVKQNKDFFAGNYNVAWSVIEKLNVSEETKLLLLNLTGTIVVIGEETQIYPSKWEESLSLLQRGGIISNAYKVQGNGIDIDLDVISIPPEKAYLAKIRKILHDLQEKILSETSTYRPTLTEEEKELLQTTHFPIGSLLSLMGQWSGKGADFASIYECADLIAFERVTDYVKKIIYEIYSNAMALRSIQIDGGALDQYIDQLNKLSGEIHQLQVKNFQKVAQKYQMIDYLINLDRELRGKERGI